MAQQQKPLGQCKCYFSRPEITSLSCKKRNKFLIIVLFLIFTKDLTLYPIMRQNDNEKEDACTPWRHLTTWEIIIFIYVDIKSNCMKKIVNCWLRGLLRLLSQHINLRETKETVILYMALSYNLFWILHNIC